MRVRSIFSALAFILAAGTAFAEFSSRGSLAIEGRAFRPDDVAATEDVGLALASRIELKSRKRPWRGKLRIFGRVGAIDSTRADFVVEEAWVELRGGRLRLRAGAQLLSWTATEAFHPADVMNARNFDSDLEDAEKIGEPMVSVRLAIGTGGVSAYYMPLRIEHRFPDPVSRLGLFPIPLGRPLWVESDGTVSSDRFARQWAVRLGQTIGNADISLHALGHHDRSHPTFVIDPSNSMIRPLHHGAIQIGATYTQAIGGWLLKAEIAHRDLDSPSDLGSLQPLEDQKGIDHDQVAAGLEYGWSYPGGHDATVVLEGQAIVGSSALERARLHPFQRDLLIGYHHAFNDQQSKELSAGAIVDVDGRSELLAYLSYDQRLSDTWRARGALRAIRAETEDGDGLQALDGDHSLEVTLTHHF